MLVVNFAASRRVNPEGTSLRLTAEQVWKGIQIKARDPVRFIPGVTSVEIEDDTGNSLTRRISLNENPPITEYITILPNALIHFAVPDKKIAISDILSYDEANELIFTICFAGGIPNQHPRETTPTPEELNQLAGVSVEGAIKHIRELVQDGTIA